MRAERAFVPAASRPCAAEPAADRPTGRAIPRRSRNDRKEMTTALPAHVGFSYRNDRLSCEECAVSDLATRFGTPLYVYSRAAIEQGFLAYANALRDRRALVCYAMKANSNLAVLQVLARLGAGFDIVS